MENASNTLTLRILNNQLLTSGKNGQSLFTFNGGSIGSDNSCHWSIQDLHQQVENQHARVDVIDSHFCLAAYAPGILLNGADIYTSKKSVRLQQGDIIELGAFRIKVQINEQGVIKTDLQSMTPQSLVSTYSNPMQELLDQQRAVSFNDGDDNREDYPSNSHLIAGKNLDPIAVLAAEQLSSSQPANHNNRNNGLLDDNQTQLKHFSSPDNIMDKSFVNLPEANAYFSADDDQSRLGETHLAMTPLLRAIGVKLPPKDSQEAYHFLEDIGLSIQAIIKGVQALQTTNESLADKHLRPIEDNPLRLNLSYQETVDLMYANDKCPVHLSAPAAISESLDNLRIHSEANQLAISESLNTLLSAFSPEALLKRFAQYRRSNERAEMDGGWAWDMYSSYFKELSSNRQQGFEKLFWELYAQTYDREIRRLQQGRNL